MSSRNRRLDAYERTLAPRLYQALQAADALIVTGATDVDAVKRAATEVIRTDGLLRLEYLEVVDPQRLERVETIAGPVLIAGALWVGGTRLIDNCLSAPPGAQPVLSS